jgi:hypothetical protein
MGRRGECPDWYELISAAKYLGVSPWDLDAQPIKWRERALIAQGAENWARRELEEREKHKRKN